MQWSTGKKLVWIVFLSLVVLAGYGWWLYSRSPPDVKAAVPSAEISADELVQKYMVDEAAANTQFLGKTLQVAGTITSVQHQPDSLVNLMLGMPGGKLQVSCLMEKNYKAHSQALVPGQAVVIKGVCTGLLMDVELNRCIVLHSP